MKKTVSVLLLLLISVMAIGQNENLMEKCHGITRDYVMRAFFEAAGINENASNEAIQEATTYYHQNEAEIIAQFDLSRHQRQVEGVAQARAERQANAFSIITSGIANVSSAITSSIERERQEAAAKQQAQELARKQAMMERINAQAAEDQARAARMSQSSQSIITQRQTNNGSNGSIKDLYTSDMSWNKMLDNLVAQHGVEKTRQIVQQLRNERMQSAQSSSSTQEYSGVNTSTQPSVGSSPSGTVVTAITSSRSIIRLNIQAGSITHYAQGGKDAVGGYNWVYVGNTSIQNMNMAPIDIQNTFGKEYSRMANLPKIGYVFFN